MGSWTGSLPGPRTDHGLASPAGHVSGDGVDVRQVSDQDLFLPAPAAVFRHRDGYPPVAMRWTCSAGVLCGRGAVVTAHASREPFRELRP
ncbi:hypothetical protein [Protofrankia symbiont of Coriaria ruscifolia]|uniref:hypothetical protein n=1 Tax=Protofrankia symbiont of Coriaria ruscifolia TaxID=1306542 RepID=UPI001041B41F|nr:hypothetical protein [Protofrankia symbiont of Coriaria ruscifolia]